MSDDCATIGKDLVPEPANEAEEATETAAAHSGSSSFHDVRVFLDVERHTAQRS